MFRKSLAQIPFRAVHTIQPQLVLRAVMGCLFGAVLAMVPVQLHAQATGQVAGLMQVNVQIPNGIQLGGYVPVVLQVGDESTTPGAVWIAVSGN